MHLWSLAFAATAAAQSTLVINVGQSGFTFSPDTITAKIGDTLEFHFFSSIHSAVQGDFSTPCEMGSLSSSGFDSGPVTSSDVFQVMVQSLDPMWFYCATPTHCQGGMVGVVNPPSSGDSLATYKANAAGTSSSGSAGKAQGGVVAPAGGSGSSSSSTPPTSSTSQASSSSSPSSTASQSSAPETSPSASSQSSIPQSSSSTSPQSSSPPATSSASVTSTSNLSSTSQAKSTSSSATSSPTQVTTSDGAFLGEGTLRAALLSTLFWFGAAIINMT